MSIATVGVRIDEVERAVNFDRHFAGFAQEIDFWLSRGDEDHYSK